MRLSDSIARAPVVRVFREALARRGAPDLEVSFFHRNAALSCDACFDAAIASFGLRRERLDPLPGEAGVVERYRFLSWLTTQQVENQVQGVVDESVRWIAERGASTGTLFQAPKLYGMERLHRDSDPASSIWLWHLEVAEDGYVTDALCVASHGRDLLERLVAAIERNHVIHERRRPGLIALQGHDERRVSSGEIAWENVLLPPGLRADIESTVREFFASRELYRRHKVAYRRGILLAGPPGNGKTTILRAIRTGVDVPVIIVGIDERAHEANLSHACDRAAELCPAILCFEDLDALVGEGATLSQFLNLIDGLSPLEGVLVIATTNRPDRIDPAIAKRPSRFDRVYFIPEPDRALRATYLEKQLAAEVPNEILVRIAAKTEGYSVAFLKELVLQARLSAIRRSAERVEESDLDAALACTKEHIHLASRGLEERGQVGFSLASGFGFARNQRSTG